MGARPPPTGASQTPRAPRTPPTVSAAHRCTPNAGIQIFTVAGMTVSGENLGPRADYQRFSSMKLLFSNYKLTIPTKILVFIITVALFCSVQQIFYTSSPPAPTSAPTSSPNTTIDAYYINNMPRHAGVHARDLQAGRPPDLPPNPRVTPTPPPLRPISSGMGRGRRALNTPSGRAELTSFLRPSGTFLQISLSILCSHFSQLTKSFYHPFQFLSNMTPPTFFFFSSPSLSHISHPTSIPHPTHTLKSPTPSQNKSLTEKPPPPSPSLHATRMPSHPPPPPPPPPPRASLTLPPLHKGGEGEIKPPPWGKISKPTSSPPPSLPPAKPPFPH